MHGGQRAQQDGRQQQDEPEELQGQGAFGVESDAGSVGYKADVLGLAPVEEVEQQVIQQEVGQ